MLLGIDTCGNTGAVALACRNGDKVELIAQLELAGKTYSMLLVPRLQELLRHNNLALADIGAIVAVSGPGSFTGMRIGLSSAKGLAEALDKPVIAVSRLTVLAYKIQAHTAALDAGRGEVYFGTYGDGKYEALLTREQAVAEQTNSLAVCEEKLLEIFPAVRLVEAPTAWDAIRFALPRLAAGSFDDLATLDGNYLRRSDAELFAKPQRQAAAAGNLV